MRFDKIAIEGAFAVASDAIVDERGSFARTFDAHAFAERGLAERFVQHSISFNLKRCTVRGLHFQAAPHAETKLVRCTRGVVFDVIVDLRRKSPTFRRWCAVELSVANRNALYIPEGCAHGFQTLVDECELEYLITPEYVPAAARGVRWDDPALAIAWPIKGGAILSDRDRQLPAFDAVEPQ